MVFEDGKKGDTDDLLRRQDAMRKRSRMGKKVVVHDLRAMYARPSLVLVLAELDSTHGDLERVQVGFLATGKSEVNVGLSEVRDDKVSDREQVV
jgi:hypothetical protein